MSTSACGWYAVVSDLPSEAGSSCVSLYDSRYCQQIRDGRIEVIFDGYLFDQPQWIREFAFEDTATDIQIILHAYRRWGRDLFQHVDGAFCLLIWDENHGELLAGHDALGKHPLYYAHTPSGMFFASNLFVLASHPAISRQYDRSLLALRLMGIWPPAGRTPFAAISRLAAGDYLDYFPHADTYRITRFWSALPAAHEEYLPETEVLDRFESEFQAAVVRCMRRQPAGILLSGGIDSVSVALIAARFMNPQVPLVACSGRINSKKPITYEEYAQVQVAQILGMPHKVFGDDQLLQHSNLVQDSADLGTIFPFPANMWWASATVTLYRQLAQDNLAILLTGSGGDEWLGVHYAYAADLLRSLDAKNLIALLRATADTGGEGWRGAFKVLIWDYGLRLLLRSLWMRYRPRQRESHLHRQIIAHLPDWLLPDPELRQEVIEARASLRPADLTEDRLIPSSFYRHHLQAQFAHSALTSQFELDFALNSHLGMQRLSPFHDRQLVHFLNRISPRTLLIGNRYKGLLRPLVARELPALHLQDQRKLYTSDHPIPLEQGLRTSLRSAAETIGASSCESLGLVDRSGFMRAARESAVPTSALVRLSNILSMERWVSSHTGS